MESILKERGRGNLERFVLIFVLILRWDRSSSYEIMEEYKVSGIKLLGKYDGYTVDMFEQVGLVCLDWWKELNVIKPMK